MNTDLSSPEATFANLLAQAERAAPKGRRPLARGPAGINLIGFPPTRCRDEIRDALQRLGVRVNAWLLPELGLRGVAAYRRGEQSVVYPARFWIDTARRILEPLGPPCHVLPAPYGWEGSLRWFERVATLVGARRKARSLLVRDAERQEFQSLAQQAREHSLGFVVSQDEIVRLTDPAACYGVPLLPLLAEMGFGLTILILGPREAGETARQALTQAWGEFSDLQTDSFADPQELAAKLQGCRCSAVYSEVFFDRRLTAAGKSQFHLAMIEPGLSGALRTQRRLLDLCRWPFYRRYARYLGAKRSHTP